MLIVLGIIGAVMIVMHSRIEQIRLRIVFDESVQISPVAITKLVNLLESPLFYVEIQDTALTSSTIDNDAIAEIEARNTLQKHGLLRPNKNSTTVFVTGKNLSDPEWKNLLSIAWPEASIISIQGVGNSMDISEPTLTNYIATSVTMEALVSIALRQNKSILDERQPNIYKGCLHDFHRTRSTYIGQSQTPKFCDAEARAVRNIYGTATLNAANDIFSKISYNK